MISPTNLSTSLSTSQSKLMTALEQLSSGKSINSAADNPAGLAQSSSYRVQLSSDAQAMNNIQDGTSLLDTAGGALGQISQGLQDIRALAVQAGNGALNASDLRSIQDQIGQISQGIDQVAGSAQFNGQNLLNGSFSQTLQSGSNAGQTQTLSLGNTSTSALGLNGLDVTTPAGQANALSALDSAIQQTNDQQSNIGAAQAGLNASLSNLSSSYQNLAATNSQISDTNYAQVSSNLSQAKVQQQASIKALAMYNATQGNVLKLLP